MTETAALIAAVLFLPNMRLSGYEQTAPLYMLIVMIPFMLFGGGLGHALQQKKQSLHNHCDFAHTVTEVMI